jgi:hypothetical protein
MEPTKWKVGYYFLIEHLYKDIEKMRSEPIYARNVNHAATILRQHFPANEWSIKPDGDTTGDFRKPRDPWYKKRRAHSGR